MVRAERIRFWLGQLQLVRLGIEYRRQRGTLVLSDNLYGMRGIKGWRVGVYSDPEQMVLLDTDVRSQFVTLERSEAAATC